MSWTNNKLELRQTIDSTYLIQRLMKPYQSENKFSKLSDAFSFGGGLKNGGLSDDAYELIKKIFRFDYMGSAEFEFGAVPAALRFLAIQASKSELVNDIVSVDKGKVVYFICPKTYRDEVIKRIDDLYLDEYKFRLKEHCGLNEVFNGSTWDRNHKPEYCGWLEIDNGFMFFTDKTMYESTCKLFGLTPR